jgi:hypothetical protein
MGSGAPPTLRIPLILLAIADLAALGMRLWPWQQVPNLPLNGATGIDPAVCLVAYVGIFLWIAHTRFESTKKALLNGALLGLLAGLFLVAEVVLGAQPPAPDVSSVHHLQLGLFVLAGILWGIAGMRGAGIAGDATDGLVAGIWSAMTSALMGCGAVMAESYLAVPPSPETLDPWKQYEGLAIGNPATQALVHSLNSVTAFLLFCPLLGAALALIFAHMAPSRKS